MQPRFGRVQRTNKSEPKAEQCFYLNRGRNHTRDYVKVPTPSGLTSDTWNVIWEVEGVPIIAAALDTGMAAVPEAWDADLQGRYMPPVPQVPPVLPVN